MWYDYAVHIGRVKTHLGKLTFNAISLSDDTVEVHYLFVLPARSLLVATAADRLSVIARGCFGPGAVNFCLSLMFAYSCHVHRMGSGRISVAKEIAEHFICDGGASSSVPSSDLIRHVSEEGHCTSVPHWCVDNHPDPSISTSISISISASTSISISLYLYLSISLSISLYLYIYIYVHTWSPFRKCQVAFLPPLRVKRLPMSGQGRLEDAAMSARTVEARRCMRSIPACFLEQTIQAH